MTTFTIPKALWLTSNRPAQNMAHRSRLVRDLHAIAYATAADCELIPVTGPVHAVWTVNYPKGVRLDKGEASNAQPTTKAILDGLVPRWLPDDGPRWVLSEKFRRGPNLDVSGVHLVTLWLIHDALVTP